MKLYKYRSIRDKEKFNYYLKALSEGYLWFADIRSLNDPSDSMIYYDREKEEELFITYIIYNKGLIYRSFLKHLYKQIPQVEVFIESTSDDQLLTMINTKNKEDFNEFFPGTGAIDEDIITSDKAKKHFAEQVELKNQILHLENQMNYFFQKEDDDKVNKKKENGFEKKEFVTLKGEEENMTNELRFIRFVEEVVKNNGGTIEPVKGISTDYNVRVNDITCLTFSLRPRAQRSVWQIDDNIAARAQLNEHEYNYRIINMRFNRRVDFDFSDILSKHTREIMAKILESAIQLARN